ncbi:unnamed protein product [Closterium sp. Naga37s-1]|nr:unnamed protein product [Closterium sp. Naga37s-1]
MTAGLICPSPHSHRHSHPLSLPHALPHSLSASFTQSPTSTSKHWSFKTKLSLPSLLLSLPSLTPSLTPFPSPPPAPLLPQITPSLPPSPHSTPHCPPQLQFDASVFHASATPFPNSMHPSFTAPPLPSATLSFFSRAATSASPPANRSPSTTVTVFPPLSPNLGAVSGLAPRFCVSAAIHHSDSNRAPLSEASALSHRHASSPLSDPLPPRSICHATKRPITRRHVATKDAVDGGSASGGGGGGSGEESDEDEEVATLVRGMTFAELCDDFECVSSPAVERTAKQLARDIHDMREDKRTLSCFAIDLKYSDSIRSFTGRDKYRRLSWIRAALQNSSVHMLGMSMESTSVLVITWQLRGYLVIPGGLLDARVTSTFTLNQISGQVIQHRDQWDVASSALPIQLAFWASRLAWAASEAIKDVTEKSGEGSKSGGGDSNYIYPHPSGDPRRVGRPHCSSPHACLAIFRTTPSTSSAVHLAERPHQDLYQAALFICTTPLSTPLYPYHSPYHSPYPSPYHSPYYSPITPPVTPPALSFPLSLPLSLLSLPLSLPLSLLSLPLSLPLSLLSLPLSLPLSRPSTPRPSLKFIQQGDPNKDLYQAALCSLVPCFSQTNPLIPPPSLHSSPPSPSPLAAVHPAGRPQQGPVPGGLLHRSALPGRAGRAAHHLIPHASSLLALERESKADQLQ